MTDVKYLNRRRGILKSFDPHKEIGHNSYVTIDRMVSEEYGNEEYQLSINYCFLASPFGDILVASTSKGICSIEFADEHSVALYYLKNKFPGALFTQRYGDNHQNVSSLFSGARNCSHPLRLHLKGSDFQFKVWEELLKVPFGRLTTYGEIASFIGKPKSARAVGSAIGQNPVAFFIPCHRVVRSNGQLGNYRWGEARKQKIIYWEIWESNGNLLSDNH